MSAADAAGRRSRGLAFGGWTTTAITYHRHRVEAVADAMEQAGFAMHAVVRREASQQHETTPQALLLAPRGPLREAASTRPH